MIFLILRLLFLSSYKNQAKHVNKKFYSQTILRLTQVILGIKFLLENITGGVK